MTNLNFRTPPNGLFGASRLAPLRFISRLGLTAMVIALPVTAMAKPARQSSSDATGPDMMGGMCGDMMGGGAGMWVGMVLMGLLLLAVIAALVALTIYLVRKSGTGPTARALT